MFDRIAGRYDLMNRAMTFGLDGRWRRLAAAQAQPRPGDKLLDVCCGTGDLALTLHAVHPYSAVTGLDFSEAMLARARRKAGAADGAPSGPLHFVRGDALALPFADGEFAAVTVGWGVRNVPDVPRVFIEMARVTRPGGRVVCLEMTPVRSPLTRPLHTLWLGRAVPALGRLVAGDAAAYSYLPASVAAFPDAEELAAIMHGAGLRNVRYRRLGLGALALHVGEVPDTTLATGSGEAAGPGGTGRPEPGP
jgi:demethylmenaquinone methyltransferase/2-methoxy-6-polyprenyl-1,4-benzoquinol methylase